MTLYSYYNNIIISVSCSVFAQGLKSITSIVYIEIIEQYKNDDLYNKKIMVFKIIVVILLS